MQTEPPGAQYVWKDDYLCPPCVEAFPIWEGFFLLFFALGSNKTSGEIDPGGEIWLNFLKIS